MLTFWILPLPSVQRLVLCYLPEGAAQPRGVMNGVDYGDRKLVRRRDWVTEAWDRLEAKRGMA